MTRAPVPGLPRPRRWISLDERLDSLLACDRATSTAGMMDLAEALAGTYPAVPLAASRCGVLDRFCHERLSHPHDDAAAAAAVAVCATIAHRVTVRMRGPLTRLATAEDARLALAAVVTLMLAEGIVPPRPALVDALALAGPGITRDAVTAGMPTRRRAVRAVLELAADVTRAQP